MHEKGQQDGATSNTNDSSDRDEIRNKRHVRESTETAERTN